MAVSAIRGGRLFHHYHHHRPQLLSPSDNSLRRRKQQLNCGGVSNPPNFTFFARYSQAQGQGHTQDRFSSPSRLQGLLFSFFFRF